MKPFASFLICLMAPLWGIAQDDLEVVVQKGHASLITSMKFSEDGRFLVTGGADQAVKLWDVRTGREIRTFSGHEESIADVDFNLQEEVIISSAGRLGGSEIKVWNIFKDDKSSKRIKGGQDTFLKAVFSDEYRWSFAINTLALAPDAKTLLWGEDHIGVQVGSVSNTRGKETLPTDWIPNKIVFSPTGELVASGGGELYKRVDGQSNQVKFWNYPSLEESFILETPNHNVHQIIFNKSGDRVAALSTGKESEESENTNTVSVYDVEQKSKVGEFTTSGLEVKDFGFSPNGKLIAIPTHGGNSGMDILIYDLDKKALIDTLSTNEALLTTMGFSPDGRILIANGQSINYWEVPSFRSIRSITFPRRIENFHINSRNEIIGLRGGENNQFLFRLDLNTISYKSANAPESNVLILEDNNGYYSPPGSATVNVCADWEMKDCSPARDIPGEWKKISTLEAAPGEELIGMTSLDEKEFMIIDPGSTGPPKVFSGHRKPVTTLAISPDKKVVASGGMDNKVIIWNLETQEKIKELVGHNNKINDLDFNHDGSVLASGASDNRIRLWETKKWTLIKTLFGQKSDVLTLDFNEDGSLLASGSGDPVFGGKSEIIIWDGLKGKKKKTFESNEGYVSKVIFRNERLYSIGNDPVINVFDTEDFDLIYSFIPVDEKNFVIYTPDDYYTTTKMAEPIVHFVNGNEVINFENYDLQFNRPDIILERIGSVNQTLKDAYRQSYLKRLKKLGFEENMFTSKRGLPVVDIPAKEDLPFIVREQDYSLDVTFSDKDFPIYRWNVWINNVPIFGSEGMELDETEKSVSKKLEFQLNSGVNFIDISCINQNGIESYKESLEVMNLKESNPDLHLVALGVSNYQDANLNLNYAEKDANDVIKLFKSSEYYGNVNVYPLFNDQVTRTNFQELKNELEKTKVDDQVVVFMAGHGILDKEFNFNFAPYDINTNDPSQNGISFDMIEDLVDDIPARQKMVFIDACHSGEIDKDEITEVAEQYLDEEGKRMAVKSQQFENLKLNVFNLFGISNSSVAMMEQIFTDLGNGTGAVVISAAAGNSYALESPEWNNGVFTYSLINGLTSSTADLNSNGEVSANELKDYISDKVFELTDGKQRPTSRKENLKSDFVVWK